MQVITNRRSSPVNVWLILELRFTFEELEALGLFQTDKYRKDV
jgi:hypothetical protein